MKKVFYDLRVFPRECGGENDAESFFRIANYLKFKALAFPLSNSSFNSVSFFQSLAKKYKLDYVTRIDVVSGNLRIIKKNVGVCRKKVEIIAVIPLSISAARLAARDSRIDMICFEKNWEFLDIKQAKMMKENEKILEICVSPILRLKLKEQYYILKKIYKAISITIRYDIPVIISSGAKSIYEMRDPRTLASFLYFLGIEDLGYKVVSTFPERLIKKNRERLENEVVRGVRIIR